jgi:hypothetical protein
LNFSGFHDLKIRKHREVYAFSAEIIVVSKIPPGKTTKTDKQVLLHNIKISKTIKSNQRFMNNALRHTISIVSRKSTDRHKLRLLKAFSREYVI